MALIIKRKEFVYEEKVILQDEKKGDSYEFEVKITEEQAQEIKELLKKKDELTDGEEAEVYKIFFNDKYDEIVENIGVYQAEDIAWKLFVDFIGKLGDQKVKFMNSVTSKSQKIITK